MADVRHGPGARYSAEGGYDQIDTQLFPEIDSPLGARIESVRSDPNTVAGPDYDKVYGVGCRYGGSGNHAISTLSFEAAARLDALKQSLARDGDRLSRKLAELNNTRYINSARMRRDTTSRSGTSTFRAARTRPKRRW